MRFEGLNLPATSPNFTPYFQRGTKLIQLVTMTAFVNLLLVGCGLNPSYGCPRRLENGKLLSYFVCSCLFRVGR